MKPSVHLSRAFGYRELGMYDQSFLELEEIQGDEKWSFEVLEAKYLACKGAKKWEHAEAHANSNQSTSSLPNRWLDNPSRMPVRIARCREGSRGSVIGRGTLQESARYVYAIGRYYALANEIQRAREYVRRAIKMDGSLRAEFLEDSAFDSVWDSF